MFESIHLNTFDIVIILIVFISVLKGYVDGFFRSFYFVISVIFSFFISFKLFKKLIVYIGHQINFEPLIIGFILFLILLIIFIFLKSIILSFLENIPIIGFFDKLLGLVGGFLKGCLIIFGITYLIMFFFNTTVVKQSYLFPYLENYVSLVLKYVQ